MCVLLFLNTICYICPLGHDCYLCSNFCVFAGVLPVMSVTEKGVFESILITNWFISPCKGTNFYLVYLGAILLGSSHLPHELIFAFYLRIFSQSSQMTT